MIKRLAIICTLLALLPALAAQAQVGQPPQLDLALADLSQRLGRAVTLNDPVSYTHLTLPTIYSV